MSDFFPLLIAVSVAVGSIFFANKKHEEEVDVISKTIFVASCPGGSFEFVKVFDGWRGFAGYWSTDGRRIEYIPETCVVSEK